MALEDKAQHTWNNSSDMFPGFCHENGPTGQCHVDVSKCLLEYVSSTYSGLFDLSQAVQDRFITLSVGHDKGVFILVK